MKLLIQLLMLFGFLLPQPEAQAHSCSKILKDKITENCSDNIFYLLKSLKSSDRRFDITQASVLYIHTRNQRNQFVPEGSQFKPLTPVDRPRRFLGFNIKTKWSFHVVLEYKGHIYDMDYAPSTKPVPVDVYFKNMFGAEWLERSGQHQGDLYYVQKVKGHSFAESDANRPLSIKMISASDYLEKHWVEGQSENKPEGKSSYMDWLLYKTKYRVVDMQDYLKEWLGI